jgi:hypothetical protein
MTAVLRNVVPKPGKDSRQILDAERSINVLQPDSFDCGRLQPSEDLRARLGAKSETKSGRVEKRRHGTWPHHVIDHQICASKSLDESLCVQSYPLLARFQSPSTHRGGQQDPQNVQSQRHTASTPMGFLEMGFWLYF